MKRIAEICTLLLMAGSFAGAQTPEDLVVPPAGAGPAPSAYAKTWDLDLRFADLKRIVIRPPHQRLRSCLPAPVRRPWRC